MRATVRRQTHDDAHRSVDRVLMGAALLLVMLLVGVQLARAADPGPSENITGATSMRPTGDATGFADECRNQA
jgi:hypothetical protein